MKALRLVGVPYTDEMIKATIAGLTAKIPISYELLSIIRVLANHPDPRKRTHYSQALHRLCVVYPHPLEPDFSPGESAPNILFLPPKVRKTAVLTIKNYRKIILHRFCTDPAQTPHQEGKGRKGKVKE